VSEKVVRLAWFTVVEVLGHELGALFVDLGAGEDPAKIRFRRGQGSPQGFVSRGRMLLQRGIAPGQARQRDPRTARANAI
jgi:hypothetical protein